MATPDLLGRAVQAAIFVVYLLQKRLVPRCVVADLHGLGFVIPFPRRLPMMWLADWLANYVALILFGLSEDASAVVVSL